MTLLFHGMFYLFIYVHTFLYFTALSLFVNYFLRKGGKRMAEGSRFFSTKIGRDFQNLCKELQI